ncbi:MAG: right-handed parallel beta-helix repeat-containing protein [Limisphaerales bacterium]
MMSAITVSKAGAVKVVTMSAGVTAPQIQHALDGLTNGGEILLPPGKIKVSQPIVLDHDFETLSGAPNQATTLYLMNGANCPVIIMGVPLNHPMQTIRHLCVRNLFIDGNRAHQERELWREKGDGSEIRNNGITVQNVSDSLIENVTCTRCRSGGLVTTLGVRRLTVTNFASFNNEFDGLACYLTMDSLFEKLYLHDNPGAGISLDLAFDHNVITNAVLESNDLGIFMRDSRNNSFKDLTIRNNRDFGVFMAQAFETLDRGPKPEPDTQCTDNSFISLRDMKNGRAAFRVNDISCTNNIIRDAQWGGSVRALSTPAPNLVTVK